MKQMLEVSEMDRAFRNCDAAYDGLFYVGVRTTGIFCRPSCPARKPLAKNVEYFPRPKEALFAGYRPCRRCRPLESAGELPSWVAELLARIAADPALRIKEGDLRVAGLSPATVRRFFVGRFGLTFQAFCRSQRLSRALEEIKGGGSLDDAAYDSGYESLSGFRDAFMKKFSVPPGQGKSKDYIRLAWVETPLGPLIAGAVTGGICLLEFTERRMLEAQFRRLGRPFLMPLVPSEHPLHQQLRRELDEYFSGHRRQFDLPLVFPGSDFQVRVWQALLRIPHGATRCYEDIARELGAPAAVRAVGRANGQNRIAILIPCHRVVNKDGQLGGYGGGLWRKKCLLDLERKDSPQRRNRPD